ncbi:MAG: hypothetical protein FJW30_24720 [Acidobacteria bacterium]|nr:hypothetical protein [Acidobacteriota bacterium]
MALFVDGNLSQIHDLAHYESSIVEVAATESIDLTAKGTVAALEIGLELQRFLTGTPGGRQYTLGNIAMSDGLKQWHVLLTLASTFRDAHFQQLNDRHKQKWKEYERLAKYSGQLLFETGVGVVPRPIPKAATPLLNQVAGNQTAKTYYVRVAWVDANGTEGSASETIALTTAEGTALTVRPLGAPAVAAGWNVYAGLLDDRITKQNNTPLPLGSTWTLPSQGLVSGAAPGGGQVAEQFLQHIPVLLRG